MKGYTRIILGDLLHEAEEGEGTFSMEDLNRILAGYTCPYNNDVEIFLKDKAVAFEKQGISATHLIFASFQNEWVLAGYFTLASKYFHVDLRSKHLGSNLRRRIKRFGTYEADLGKQIIAAPLIGQLGKNFTSGANHLITGDELLQIACDTVKESQAMIGGRLVYLECEDTLPLVCFYKRNGFFCFGRRMLEEKESRYFKGEYLVQMLKYMK